MRQRLWWWGGALVCVAGLALWWLWPSSDESDPVPTIEAAQPPEPGVVDGLGAVPPQSEPAVIEATLESGVVVHLQRRPRLNRPTAPFGPHYAGLLSAAQSGDTAAQYRLGLMLYECRELPEDAAQLAAQIDRLQQTHRIDQWDVSDPEAEAVLLQRRHADCAGVPQAAREEYRQWLQRAADAGLMEARLNLMYHLPKAEFCQFIENCTPQQRVMMDQLREEARAQVSQALDAGSAEALRTFGAWHLNEEMFTPNEIEAYAHFLAYDQVQRAAGRESPVAAMLESLRKRLRPVDLDAAEQRTAQLLSNPQCCVLTH